MPKKNEDNNDVDYDGFESFIMTDGGKPHPDDASAANMRPEDGDEDRIESDEVGADEFDDDELAAGDDAQDDDGLVEVTIKGQKHMVAPSVAASIEDWRREVRSRDGRLGGENAQLRERLARLEGVVEAQQHTAPTTRELPEIKPPSPQLFLDNPDEWQRQFAEFVTKQQQREADALVERYESDKAAEQEAARVQAEGVQWANGFYAEYPQFNKPGIRAIVSNLYTSNESAILAAGDATLQYEVLAEMTRDTLEEGFGAREPGRKPQRNRPPHLEGKGNPRGKKPKDEPTKPVSLSAATRRRANQVIEGRGRAQE